MNDETKRLQDRYDQDEIMGYICMDCWNDNYYAEKKRTVIVQFGYRVSHLVKKHGYKKSKLPKEYSLDESEDYGTRFSLKLKTNIVCPHCDEVLDRSVRILSSDFEHYHCFNKQCPYEKKHNHFYSISELVVPKRKGYCTKPYHSYNGDKPCPMCISAKEMNKVIQPIFQKIFG